ncbi:MAG: hypothetical protein FVQ80_06205 [Planctomycetes bacterium]|nr:hypothetical protein [Planctomycetota bacterium]
MVKRRNKISERVVLTWLMIAGLLLLFAPQALTNKIQFTFIRLFKIPLSVSRSITQKTNQPKSEASVVDRSKYIQLRNHLANNIQWLHQERHKVEMLSGLRDRTVWDESNLVMADIITAFMGKSRNEFVINRGKNDGLAKGQFVLGDYSVIGTITQLDSKTARVRLITDPASRIAVEIAEINASCLMQGQAQNSAKIQLLPIKHMVKVNDVVCAGKKPGFLEVPIITGVVVKCEKSDENPLIWDITVRPACDIQRLKSVTVIINKTTDKTSNS